MDYTKLFADIHAAILNSGETIATFSMENGIKKSNLDNWIIGSKPTRYSSVKEFFIIIDALEIPLLPYADVESVGGRIEYLRLDRRLNALELSAKVGCHPNTIADWERGRIMPNHKLNALAESLSTTPAYIMVGNKEIEPQKKYALSDLPQPTVQMTFEEAVPVEVVPEIDDTPVDDVEPEVVDVEPEVVEAESRPLVPIVISKIGDNKVKDLQQSWRLENVNRSKRVKICATK